MFKIISGLLALVAVCNAGVYQTALSGLPVAGAKILNGGALSSGYVSGAALPAVGGSYYSNPIAVSSGALGGSYYSSGAVAYPSAGAVAYPSAGAVAYPSAGAVAYPSAGAVAVPAVGAVGVGAVGVPAVGAVGVGGVQNIYAEHAHVEPGHELLYKVQGPPIVKKQKVLVAQIQPKVELLPTEVKRVAEVVHSNEPSPVTNSVQYVKEPGQTVENVHLAPVHQTKYVINAPKTKSYDALYPALQTFAGQAGYLSLDSVFNDKLNYQNNQGAVYNNALFAHLSGASAKHFGYGHIYGPAAFGYGYGYGYPGAYGAYAAHGAYGAYGPYGQAFTLVDNAAARGGASQVVEKYPAAPAAGFADASANAKVAGTKV